MNSSDRIAVPLDPCMRSRSRRRFFHDAQEKNDGRQFIYLGHRTILRLSIHCRHYESKKAVLLSSPYWWPLPHSRMACSRHLVITTSSNYVWMRDGATIGWNAQSLKLMTLL